MVELVGIDAIGGAVPPSVDDFEGFILPGSKAGVYDELDWMEPLRALLQDIRETQMPIFGICFGHQMMAHSFGGRTEKADKGFCLGSRDFIAADGETIRGHASHQDQVVKGPPGATVMTGSDYYPVAELHYDLPAMSTQFHPEYGTDFIEALANLLEGDLMTEIEAQAARNSIAARPAAKDLFAEKFAAFFRAHL